MEGRRIAITGAASGIGFAMAQLFLREGGSVLAMDRDATALAHSGERLEATSGALVACAVADVTDTAQVQRAIAYGEQQLGGLDGIVNSAGLDLLRPFAQMTLEDWNRVVAVNMTGPALVCMAALPALKRAGRGTIVNVASGAGLRPLDQRSAYCAAKAGLVMLGKQLALELAPLEIRANTVCPGVIDTPMFRASYEHADDPEQELEKIMERFAIKRVGQPIDIAHAALYLTSDESRHVTGSTLAVDGGRAFH
ncbi:MAG: SDR family NAD(P)-dependent oxidoreductase [Lautropia sp.]